VRAPCWVLRQALTPRPKDADFCVEFFFNYFCVELCRDYLDVLDYPQWDTLKDTIKLLSINIE
jgi:hypothetical protein